MIKEIKRKKEKDWPNISTHKLSENPKVTVIVPVYKVDKYLTNCLNSIVNQTMEELEIIIVDEGDHDRCREIIDFFEARDPRIVAPHQKNGGYGASCNLGLSMARGEYIAIVESDDCIEPWMYEEMYAYAKQLDADVVKSPFILADNYGRHDYPFREYFRTRLPSDLLFSAKEYNSILRFHGAIWSAIYKASYLREKNITFPEARGGAYVDIVFRYDTLTKTNRIAWLNRTYYVYTVEDYGEQHNNHNIGAFISRWRDIHDRLNKETAENRNAYAPALLYDEVGDTLSKLRFAEFSPQEIQMLAENFKFVEENVIEAAMHLDGYSLEEQQAKEIRAFKRNPKLYYKNAKQFRGMKKTFDRAIQIADKLANTTLLIWFFIITLSTILAQGMILLNLNVEANFPGFLYDFCGVVGCVSLIGCLICCLGKISRKLCFKLLDQYRKKREEKKK